VVDEILAGQPFSTYDDLKERTTRRSLNAPKLELLSSIGALESLGIPKDKGRADEIQFALLGFTLQKPRALRGIKPRHTGARESGSGWQHLGRETGVEASKGRSSVSKLFWIPTTTKLSLKASPWAQVKTWILTVIDENGLAFDLMVNEDKKYEAMLVNFLHKHCQGATACLDGMIRMPFLSIGPQGFRLFGVTGSYNGDPQLFGVQKKHLRYVKALQEAKGFR